MQNELLNEGVTLMLAGMGTVFALLTVLVVTMSLMSWFVAKMQDVAGADEPGDEEIAAISAAVARHRDT